MGGENDPAERRAVRVIWIGIVPVAAISAMPLLLDPDAAQVYSNLANPLIVSLAGVLGWVFATRAHSADARLTSALFATGLLCWGIAEAFWGYYNYYAPDADLDVSPADGFWLFGYAPLIVAAVLALRRYDEYLHLRQVLVIFAVWVAGFAVALVPYLIIVWDSASSTLAAAVFIAYPILDYLLLLPLALLLVAYRAGRMYAYWLFLIIATFLLMAADLTYGVRQAEGVYRSGDFPDALYIMGYGLYMMLFLCLLVFRVRYESSEPGGRYSVMEAFLLSPSGTVIASARRAGWEGSVDPEVVGAMAGIVRHFAGSAFRDPNATALDQLSFGQLRLSYEGVEPGFVLVVATHGTPTGELRERMKVAVAGVPRDAKDEMTPPAWAEALVRKIVDG